MNDEYALVEIQKLRRIIIELSNRLSTPANWSSGELEIFTIKLKKARTKLSAITETNNYKY